MDVNEEEKQVHDDDAECDIASDTVFDDCSEQSSNSAVDSSVQVKAPETGKTTAFNVVLTALLVVAVIVTYFATVSVSSSLRNSPGRAVNSYFPYIYTSLESNILDATESDTANDIIDLCFEFDGGVDYQITNVVKDYDYASVDVDFTFKDHSTALNDTISYMQETYDTANISHDDFYDIFVNQLGSNIADEDETLSSVSVTFTCIQDGKSWVVDYSNINYNPFYVIYSGNTYSTLVNMSNGYYF